MLSVSIRVRVMISGSLSVAVGILGMYETVSHHVFNRCLSVSTLWALIVGWCISDSRLREPRDAPPLISSNIFLCLCF